MSDSTTTSSSTRTKGSTLAPPPPPTDFPKPGIEVNCLATGVAVKVRMTDTNFHGVMYVKGHSHDPRCRKAVEPGQGVRPIDFEVDFDTCGLFHYQVGNQGGAKRSKNWSKRSKRHIFYIYTSCNNNENTFL